MPDPEKDEPKLIIDEDWKESVQREKEQAAAKAKEATAPGAEPSEEASGGEDGGAANSDAEAAAARAETAGGDREHQLPPASFDFLVTTLATQAMMALGQLPGPEGKLGEVEKPIAKHYIDLLAVLEEKTKGNLDAGEQKLLAEVLHNLRMAFVAVKPK